MEIHQSSDLMGRVQAVIPNTPEAEQMILMMNKNFPAYVGHVLRDQGLPDEFLMELFNRSCCPTMISEMGLCTWDPDTGTLTTPQESMESQNLAELEKAAWYKDAFEGIGSTKMTAPRPPSESLFNLDKDRSIKTIHHRNNNRPTSASGISPPRKRPNNEVVDATNSDEDSASSSSDDGSYSAAADGDEEDLPASSAEANGQAPGTTDGG